jgi:hypothetical protein
MKFGFPYMGGSGTSKLGSKRTVAYRGTSYDYLTKDLEPYLLNFYVQVQKMSLCVMEIIMFGY